MEEVILYVVVPCYNEETVLNETPKRLQEKLTSLIASNKISPNSKVLFVDDGSKDKTWNIIEELHKNDKMFQGGKTVKKQGASKRIISRINDGKKILYSSNINGR